MTDLSITDSAGGDGVVHLAVTGEIDMASSPMFADRLRDAIHDDTTKTVVADLGEVTFMDSNGIRELVVAREMATERGVTFYIANPNDVPRRVLELTGLLPILTAQAPPA